MTWGRVGALAVATYLACLHASAAVREPTPEEKKVLDKIAAAITSVFDSFASPDWAKTEDWYNGTLECNISPDRPIDVNNNFERTYQVPRDSKRGRNLLMPLFERLQKESDPQAQMKLGEQVGKLNQLKVWAYINRLNVPAHHQATTRPAVSGAALVEEVDDSDEPFCNARTGPCYLIGFGNWKTARQRNGLTEFHFVHPPRTPYVENVVVRINGAEDRVLELLRTANWNQLNEGLSP